MITNNVYIEKSSKRKFPFNLNLIYFYFFCKIWKKEIKLNIYDDIKCGMLMKQWKKKITVDWQTKDKQSISPRIFSIESLVGYLVDFVSNRNPSI